MSGSFANPAVLDTNVVFSGLTTKTGAPFLLLELWRASSFRLVITEQLVDEYRSVFNRPKFLDRYDPTEAIVEVFFQDLDDFALKVSQLEPLPVTCRDPKDHIVLAAAMALQGVTLVTGDNDLLSLAADPLLGNLKIIRARAFLDSLFNDG